MIPYPNIDPDLISLGPIHFPWFTLGPIHVRWYGVMYVLGFLSSYYLIQKQKRSREMGLVGTAAQDYIFYLAVGLIVGARLGYLLFYQYHDYLLYLEHPLEIFATWHGGMSFHGGLVGVVIAGWLFCRRRKLPLAAVADSTAVTVPIGLGLGRIGNFINGELPGRPTDVAWGMVFPNAGALPRHPSQLYEAALEGLVLFILLWLLRQRAFKDGMMFAFLMFFYGIFRFCLEFFREPDPQLGYILGFLTMGQILCLAMVLAACILAVVIHRIQPAPEAPAAAGRPKASKGGH